MPTYAQIPGAPKKNLNNNLTAGQHDLMHLDTLLPQNNETCLSVRAWQYIMLVMSPVQGELLIAALEPVGPLAWHLLFWAHAACIMLEGREPPEK